MSKLFAVLVGVNAYPENPLSQCVNDVSKMETYLNQLGDSFDEINITSLVDHEAIKPNVINALNENLSLAGDNDTALFYYSGHGAQEKTDGRFPSEHDGLLECLVCMYKDSDKDDFLLADKELRYIFSQFPNNPHLVSVFDCCHSGDMMRNMLEEEQESGTKRRLVKQFPPRPFERFDFIKDEQLSDDTIFQNQNINDVIPIKPHIHVAACLASQVSWEDEKGGVLTRYLIKLLENNNHALSYQDIAKYAKISLKSVTEKKQTPIVEVKGGNKMDLFQNWLGMDRPLVAGGKLVHNNIEGWHYTNGSLMGLKKGMELEFDIDENTKGITTIALCDLEKSLVIDPFEKGFQLDFEKSYAARTTMTTYETLGLAIQNLDKDEENEAALKTIITDYEKVELTSLANADFQYNIFNQCLYVSKVNDPFRPLTEQIDLLGEALILKPLIEDHLKTITKWNHFNTLNNPSEPELPLVSISFSPDGDDQWLKQDMVNQSIELIGVSRSDVLRKFRKKVKVRVTNTGHDPLFVTAFVLSDDFSINTGLFETECEELSGEKPFREVLAHRKENFSLSFGEEQEVYNWKSNSIKFKFIVSTDDFSASFGDIAQAGLASAIVLDDKPRSTKQFKGNFDDEPLDEKEEKWAVYTFEVNVVNPKYNEISGKLKEFWPIYEQDELVGPFISKLYFESKQEAFDTTSFTLENKNGAGQNAKDLLTIKKNIGNFLDNSLRLRKFKKARKIMPAAPVIVAEGDSWFLYPILVKDTLDYVSEAFPLRSLAAAGAELQEYKSSGQLLNEIDKLNPSYVLISGGGNDVVGPEVQFLLLDDVGEGKEPEDYLDAEKYAEKRKSLMELYDFFFEEIKKKVSVKHTFVHGYANVKSTFDNIKMIEKGWVNKYMLNKGMQSAEDRQKLILYLVDNFNEDLSKLVAIHDHVTYLDMRPLVNDDEWFDEIHPNDAGFKKVGQKFIDAIKSFES